MEKNTPNILDRCFPAGYKTEQKSLLRLAGPIIISAMLDQALHPVSVAFAGNLGKIELDSAALGISLAASLGITTSSGFLGVCSTYFSQSYGSVNQKQMGVTLQTGLYMIILTFILSFAVFVNGNSLLLLMGQNPEIARNAEVYLMFYMPCLFLRNVNQLLQRYLNAQNITYPSMVFALLNNILHIGLQYLFVYVLGWGIRGSAGAISLIYFVNTGEHLAYILITRSYEDTWNGWTRESLLDWAHFVKLGIATMLLVSVEWMAIEAGTILVGLLGEVELGATAIMFQLWPMFGSLGAGLRDAISVLIGQHLGAKSPLAALTACRIAWINAICIGMLTGIVILILRDFLPSIFTQDPDVLRLTTDQMPILAIFAFLVIIKWTCSGIIFGCGMQVIGGFVSCISYLLVVMPIGVPLMFLTKIRSSGYWWGLNAGLIFAAVAYFVIFNRADWDEEAENAQKRAKAGQIKTTDEKEKSTNAKTVNGTLVGDDEHDELTWLLRLGQNGFKQQENTAAYTDKSKLNGSLDALKHMDTSAQYGGIQNQSPTQISDTSEDLSSDEWKKIYIFRSMNVLACVLIVLFGILCRCVLFIPPTIHSFNTTMSTNISELLL